MAILDEDNLLSEEERKAYQNSLKLHGYKLHHFLVEILEDQRAMDMNDINYVVLVKAKATHLEHGKSKIYYSPAGTGSWLTEFEQDLKAGFFEKDSPKV